MNATNPVRWLPALAVCALLLAPSIAHAAEIRSGQAVVIPEDEIIEGNLYAAGSTVQILGTVTGDVYAAGDAVVIAGEVQGDVYAAASQLLISADVGDDVVVAAGNLAVDDASVGDNLSAAAGTMRLDYLSVINGTAHLASGELELDGAISGDLLAAAGDLAMNGVIGGDALLSADQINVLSGTSVAGDLSYHSPEEIQADGELPVGGEVRYQELRQPEYVQAVEGASRALRGLWKAFVLLSSLLSGIALMLLFPKLSREARRSVRYRTMAAGLVGLVVGVVTPFALLLLAGLIVTFPLAIIAGGVYLLLLYLSVPVAGLTLGRMALDHLGKKDIHDAWAFVIGYLLVWLISLVPILGPLVIIAGCVLGLGGICLALYQDWLEIDR